MLEGYLNLSGALSTGVPDAKFREQLALAVAQANSCECCLAAHSAIGKMVGLKPEEIELSRESRSSDRKRDAGLKFAQSVVLGRGMAPDSAMDAVRAAGYSDAEIVEIVAHVALNFLTKYFNLVAETEVDFPRVPAALKQTA